MGRRRLARDAEPHRRRQARRGHAARPHRPHVRPRPRARRARARLPRTALPSDARDDGAPREHGRRRLEPRELDHRGLLSGTTQLGTHLDALSHLQIGGRGYDGLTVDDIATPTGVSRLGIETVPQIVTRGWLVDVSGRELGPGGVVGIADVEGIDPGPGDAVIFHTGWSSRWDDAHDYLQGQPGPGV